MNSLLKSFAIATGLLTLGACSDSETDVEQMTAFTLNFAAQSGDETLSCDSQLSGYGHEGHFSIGVNDLRLYVSNIQLLDMDGNVVEATFDDNEFQLNHEEGFVGLVDFTSNSSGSCQSDAIQYSEGTARTNHVITGVMADKTISKITFDVGVPQAVMKSVISNTSAEDAPSPLNEMYWSWASGYRHFVMNFAIEDMNGVKGEGAIHLGSRGCGGEGLLALEGKDSCDLVNTPKVALDNFDIHNQTIVLDIDQVLANLMFKVGSGGHGHGSQEEGHSDDMMMEKPAVTCHSADPMMQPDCAPIFTNFGMTNTDGKAMSDSNKTMVIK